VEDQLWLILVANFPLVLGFFIALQRGYIYVGRTFDREMKEKQQEIEFREQIRQEALADKALLESKDRERTAALQELTTVVKQALELNDRLLQDTLREWDGRDRRTRKNP
jgi:hypothetical protein